MPYSRPSQSRLKQYLEERREKGGPPPAPEEVRRQLGWDLIKAEQEQNQKKPA